MTVEQAMALLNPKDLLRLQWSFEAGQADYVCLTKAPGVIVGVHLHQVDHLEIVETSGKWSTAKRKVE